MKYYDVMHYIGRMPGFMLARYKPTNYIHMLFHIFVILTHSIGYAPSLLA
jgi:hypothetical protein